MNSADPTPRLLAAGASLTGTGILMCRTEPSWDGILIGLLCLGLWALGTLATRPGPVTRPTRTIRPVLLEAVVVERPRPPPLLLPAPRTSADDRGGSSPSRLPDRPTHRPRVIGRRRG